MKKKNTKKKSHSPKTNRPSLNSLLKQADKLLNQDKLSEAEALCRKILSRNHGNSNAHNLFGTILQKSGHLDKALDCFNQAITLAPRNPDFHYNRAICLKDLKRYPEAVESYQKAIQLKPDYIAAHVNQGISFYLMNEYAKAVECYLKAIDLGLQCAQTFLNLGTAYAQTKQYDLSIKYCLKAVKLQPEMPDAHFNLANAYKFGWQYTAAIKHYQRALELNPNLFKINNNLGNTFKNIGRIDEALEQYEAVLDKAPGYLAAASNRLLTLLYWHGDDAAEIYEAHRAWAERTESILLPTFPEFKNSPLPERRLKIGYISADFRDHSVSFFFEPIIRFHDNSVFETFCYADVPVSDNTTHRLKELADNWRDINKMSADDVVDLIKKDEIDILVDLAGHTAHNWILVFMHKPAPVQVTYLGYAATTGLTTIDYRLTDKWADPVGVTDQFHSEKLIRLPDGFLCYQSPAESPDVEPTPAKKNRYITFGSFNNFSKISPAVIESWASILKAVPDSRLIVKAKALQDVDTKKRTEKTFKELGIDIKRIQLQAIIHDKADHLALYNKVDIGLDTYPYNGTTTTCEALWMGVPVVVLAGKTHVSRVGVSLLSNIDLTECIAESENNYIETAVRLANDVEHLQELRSTMRERMLVSNLTQAEPFTRTLEQAYREMWRTWCDNHTETGTPQRSLSHASPEATTSPSQPSRENYMTEEFSGNPEDLSPDKATDAPPPNDDIVTGQWVTYLSQFPYAVALLPLWESYLTGHSQEKNWQFHQVALDYYSVAQGEDTTPDTRKENLQKSFQILVHLISVVGNLATLQSFSRVAIELEEYDKALLALNYLLKILEDENDHDLSEPFIPVLKEYDSIDPEGDIGGWIVRSINEQTNNLQNILGEKRDDISAGQKEQEEVKPMEEDERKLHIGGKQKHPGWEILNAIAAPEVDHVGNANDLSRFPDDTFSEIYASHVLEHFDYKDELPAVLNEWRRVLKPGGRLCISVPDLDTLATHLLQKDTLTIEQRFHVMRMMFGGHVDAYDYHQVGLNQDFLTGFLNNAGFKNIQKVDCFDFFDDTSSFSPYGVPISLNMIAEKNHHE